MNTSKIFDGILNLVFFFLGDKVKGYRTIILNVVMVILGLLTWLTADGGLFAFLCSQGEVLAFLTPFCSPETLSFYSIMMTVVGVLNIIARRVTDLPVGYNNGNAPASLRIGDYDTGTSPVIDGIVIMSLIFVVLTAIFTGDFIPLIVVLLALVLPMTIIAFITAAAR